MPFNPFATVSTQMVLDEIARVERAVVQGDLAFRAELAGASPQTRAILDAVNGLLDSAMAPVTELGREIATVAMEHDRGTSTW